MAIFVYITLLNITMAVTQEIVNADASNLSHARSWQTYAKGLGHVTPKIFGIRSNVSSKLLELETSNLVHSFLLEKPSGCSNNIPQKGRVLGHVTPKIFGIQSNLSSKLLELET